MTNKVACSQNDCAPQTDMCMPQTTTQTKRYLTGLAEAGNPVERGILWPQTLSLAPLSSNKNKMKYRGTFDVMGSL